MRRPRPRPPTKWPSHGYGRTRPTRRRCRQDGGRKREGQHAALALHLQVPISWFFEGLEEPTAENAAIKGRQTAVDAFLTSREGVELALAFPRIRSGQRGQILALVRTLAADEEFAQDD